MKIEHCPFCPVNPNKQPGIITGSNGMCEVCDKKCGPAINVVVPVLISTTPPHQLAIR